MSTFAATETTTEAVKPVEYFRKDYNPSPYFIKQWFLDFRLDEAVTTVIANATVVKQAATWEDLVLDGEELELLQVIVNNQVLESGQYEYKDDKLRIFAKSLPQVDEQFKLQTIVNVHPNKNLQLCGLYQSGKAPLLCTQCEAMGFRRITFSLDRPDVLSLYRVRLEADKAKYPVLLSNGNRIEEGILANSTEKHYAIWEDPFPKPSYLFALVAGDLASISDSYTTGSGRTVSLGIYSDKENADKLDHAMYSLKESMKWDEKVFSLECDLDCYNVVATNDFNMGAMENKGLNVFNSAYVLADAKTATDTDYENILGVIGHEYFHNWTGNRVTVRDWFQLTLKEGLTVFRDQWFSSDMISNPAIKRIQDVKTLRARQFTEDAGPMAHPIRPESYISMDNFYTATVYEKGCEIIGIYKTLFGEQGFLNGMKVYINRNDGKAVTCDDFLQAMIDANPIDSSVDLPKDFDPKQIQYWYSQAGTPNVTLTTVYDPESKQFKLTASQRTPTTPGIGQKEEDKHPVVIPLVTGLLHPVTGEELSPSKLLLLTQKEQTFIFENVSIAPVVSTLRDFSAPVILHFPQQTQDELGILMQHDTDAFNAWEAGQRYWKEVLLETASQLAASNGSAKVETPVKLVEITQGILVSALTNKKDFALIASSLQLPDDMSLANAMMAQLGYIDIESLYQAKKQVKYQLVQALLPHFLEVYQYLSSLPGALGEYQFTPQEVSRRTLRNTCLDYISTLASDERADLIALMKTHFDGANCMTDKVAALRVLASIPSSERTDALTKFYTEAQGNALVINKWFGLQAQADYPTILEDLKALKAHPDFTLSNPNRARSLLSTFSMSNLYHFHQASGAGYAFMVDNILEIDTMNPQVSARMISSSFALWKQFDPARKTLMKEQLQRIQSAPKLSPDAFEIVNRFLQE